MAVVLRGDKEAEIPILKDLTMKKLRPQVEFASMHGCPLSMLKNDDDDEPDGEDDAGDGDSDDAAVPDVGSERINAATVNLEMLSSRRATQSAPSKRASGTTALATRPRWGAQGAHHGWATASATTSATPRSATGTTATASIARGPSSRRSGSGAMTTAQHHGSATGSATRHATQQCRYDNGDCAPDSCLIALTPDMSVGLSAMGAELSMGGARFADGATPDSPHPGAVWYDLSDFGLQSLSIPAGSVNVPDRGGGMVDLVRLSLALCSPLPASAAVIDVPECADKAHELRRDQGSAENASIAMLATSRDGECILSSLGARKTMDKQLIDPSMPLRGVQLEFGGGAVQC